MEIKEAYIGSFSVQKAIYRFMVLNLTIICWIIIRPHQITPFIQSKKFLTPFVTLISILLILFLHNTLTNYWAMSESAPELRSNDNIDFVRWAKEFHKMQRDLYLSLCTLLSVAVIVVYAYMTEKYEKMVETKNTEIRGL